MTERDPNAPKAIDESESASGVEIRDSGVVKVNPAIANAPTVRGDAVVVPIADEPRNHALAVDTAKRALKVTERIDLADPIVARVVNETIVLLKRLGAGGMGSVYLGVDTQAGLCDRRYAIKVMAPTVAQDELDRFVREVSAAARVQSKRVAQVYRYGVFRDRRPWILMEYVHGISLEDEIARHGVLTVDYALSRVGLGLVRAIADVHDASVIHKDLKPSNIMIEYGPDGPGDVKLLDFGIARIGGVEKLFPTPAHQCDGTPGYWSPESVAGQAIEYRTDVWGIAVVLFEVLTGELPFGKPTNMADVQAVTAAMLAKPAPSVNEIRRRKGLAPVSPAIERLVADCLDKRVRERPDVAELHTRLRGIIEAEARRAGRMNPLLTMRSEARPVRIPANARTQAQTDEALAVDNFVQRFAGKPSAAFISESSNVFAISSGTRLACFAIERSAE